MSSFCNSCHGGGTPSAGIKLDTYNDVKIQAQMEGFGALYHMPAVIHLCQRMQQQLNTCNLAKIKKWLDAGYPDN